MTKRFVFVLTLAGLVSTWLSAQSKQALSPAPEFVPDTTFTGSSLTSWQPLGDATWRAANGEIVGTPSSPGGGWLVLNRSYQDLQCFSRVRCDGACTTGLLLRMQKTPTGTSGIFVSLKDGDFTSYRMTLDAAGNELTREPITNITWGTIRTGAAGRAGGGGGRANAGPGDFRAGIKLSTPLAELDPPAYGVGKQPDGWDQFQVIYDSNIVRPYLNNTNQMPPSITDDSAGYGPIALYVGGAAAVRFKDVSFKDLAVRRISTERFAPRFRMQQLEEFSYAWGAATADFNKDGSLDVTAGPYIYYGPDFATRREIYLGTVAGGYPANMVTHAFDFTGDGWIDVLATESRPMVLYVNPGTENRRWERHAVLPPVSSETTAMGDLDGDKRPEVVFSSQGTMVFAKYDPANPTTPWVLHKVSDPGHGYGHSSGIGDVNGDGRPDILQTAGWWEQRPVARRRDCGRIIRWRLAAGDARRAPAAARFTCTM